MSAQGGGRKTDNGGPVGTPAMVHERNRILYTGAAAGVGVVVGALTDLVVIVVASVAIAAAVTARSVRKILKLGAAEERARATSASLPEKDSGKGT
jgi:hypothetical protein